MRLRQSQTMHCIIAYAASHRLPPDAPVGLPLPRLAAWLARLQAGAPERDTEQGLPPPALPHERAHARALGWDPQAPLPWAAWQTGARDAQPQAWIMPVHWQIGMDQVVMHDPAALRLSDDESQALLTSLRPYLQEDGLAVRWHDALHWHAQGPMLAGWPAPSLDRVINANVRPWITAGLPGALVRLQSEMQMLAYQHPVNDARLARGQLPVNAFWVHGAGSLKAQPPAIGTMQCHDTLRASALRGDVPGWRSAWQTLDALLPEPDTPGLQLTLCSESAAQTWQTRPQNWLSRMRRVFSPIDTTAALRALIPSP
mgnify:CR=1 FL=1